MEIVARPGSAAGTAGCRASKRKLREPAQGLAGFADTGVSLQVRPKQCVDGGPILEGPHAGLLQEPVVNRDRQVGQGILSPVLHGFSVARASGLPRLSVGPVRLSSRPRPVSYPHLT